jgi:hypothetical protein
MDTLQKLLNEILLNAPYEAVADMIAVKLAERGITLTSRERLRLIAHVKAGSSENFTTRKWRWWDTRHVGIEITEAEIDSLHTRFTDFLENRFPDLLQSIVADLAERMLPTLNREWPAQARSTARELRGFEKRLHHRWGLAIDRLQMFVALARELGESTIAAFPEHKDPPQPHLLDVLVRIHARACQVAEEVICLLSAGFADGAMARWRTLHEIAVVALFLSEHGESLAERYVDHQAVESLWAANDYQRCCHRLGYEPLSEAEMAELAAAVDDTVKRYGPRFKTQYGWAAEVLGNGRPTFSDIERSVHIDHFRAHYRMASHNVHANPKGVFFKLGLLSEVDALLAGAKQRRPCRSRAQYSTFSPAGINRTRRCRTHRGHARSACHPRKVRRRSWRTVHGSPSTLGSR